MKKYEYSELERKTIEQSPLPYAIYQFLGKAVETLCISKGFCELFGYESLEEAYEVMNSEMYRYVHQEDVPRITDVARRFGAEKGDYNVVFRVRTKEEYHVIHANGRHIYPEPGTRLALVWYVDEGICESLEGEGAKEFINQSQQMRIFDENREHDMNYDYMTGLPSMTYFFRLAEAGRIKIIEDDGDPAMLFLDLNGMKHFNRKYGFAEGDVLIKAFARLLIKYFGLENSSRFGQDHFAVFTRAEGLEAKLDAMFEEVKTLNDGKNLPVKVGIYHNSMGAVEASLACDRAKYACKVRRNDYQSYYIYFDRTMLANELHRQYIIDNLDRAISENWIHAYYQPIVRATNGRICDEEALARWVDPVMGMLSPADFIPILEDSKLIYKLDLHIVDVILKKMKDQSKKNMYVVPISVNLSRTDFETCDIVEEVRKRVDEAGVDRSKLTIEITESVIGDNFDYMKTQVERFQQLGFRVWMDDFGSGYSSLDVLQEIRFDLIKMDMRFMKEFENGEKSRIILSELIRMAIALGIDTVTEGVETEAQRDFLREVGCTKLQGYFFSKPVSLEEIFRQHEEGSQMVLENPNETKYYEALGRINLYDLSIIASEDSSDNADENLQNYFVNLPMAVYECDDDGFTVIRCNQSYRDFLVRNFGVAVVGEKMSFDNELLVNTDSFVDGIRNVSEIGGRVFVREQIAPGKVIKSFIRSIGSKPGSNVKACVIVVLEIGDGSRD
ncbi:MAG: EAL domain-containing protein [Lachnospiraceae bacterium]|nr:EAL domain-containing protein [Lachnospiraceae bacterium]